MAAGKIFEQLADDIDPREAERQRAAEAKAARARTFGVIARRFLADCHHLRLRSIGNIESALRPVIAEWEDHPIAGIRRRDVIELVDRIKVERGPGAATKAQAWVRRVFNWAIDKAKLEASPAAGLRRPAPVRTRNRVLSDDEVRRLWIACEQQPYPFGRYVQLLLLTDCRRSELATLRWTDVDFGERAIVIPGDRYKTGKPHLIPLSRQAIKILEELPRVDLVFVFPGRGGGKPIAAFTQLKARIDALLGRLIERISDPRTPIPAAVCSALAVLAGQLVELTEQINKLKAGMARRCRSDAAAARLVTIPGVGPITASAILAAVPDIQGFRSGRDFAALLGLVPPQNSSGGKTRLGTITKMGDRTIRRLLVTGALSVIRWGRKKPDFAALWIGRLVARKPLSWRLSHSPTRPQGSPGR